MIPQSITCPSCGAPHEVHNPGVMMVSCEYCGNAVYWDEDKIRDAGKQSHLPEGFSRLYRGATGELFHKRFVVLGRARYSFGHGFWDEWFLELQDGSLAWLSEDNHELALQKPLEGAEVGLFTYYQPGMTIKIKGKEYHVQEVGAAECIGVEGDLPKVVTVGEKYNYVDASSLDGKYILSIEYDDEKPSVYLGNWLNYTSLKLDDEDLEW